MVSTIAATAADLESSIQCLEMKISTYKCDNEELVHKVELIR